MNRGTELNRKPKKIPGSDKPVPEKTNKKSQRSWISQSLIIIIVDNHPHSETNYQGGRYEI